MAALAMATAEAHAEAPTLDGTWAASPLTVQWVIGDWGAACGPRPAGGGEAGAAVIVHETAGELVLTGGGRVYSTTGCWEQYPGIQRISHSGGARAWKTTCKTPAGDARQATITTSLTATDDRIQFYETGQYQFVIQGQNCTASVGRYRTYSLVQRATPPELLPSASAAAPSAPSARPPAAPTTVAPVDDQDKAGKPDPASRCRTPGPPARLEVRPSRKLLKAGDEFAFRAVVMDSQGCFVPARPTWSIEGGAAQGDVSPSGVVKVKPDAGEGEMRVTAAVGGRATSVTVEIASTVRYDSLLKGGTFNAAGEIDVAAAVSIATQSIGAAPAIAEDEATGRKRLFVVVIGGAALALAALGAFLLLRRRRAAAPSPRGAEAPRAGHRASPTTPSAVTPAPPVASAPGPGPRVAPPPPAAPGGGAYAGAPPAAPSPPTAPGRKTLCPVCGAEYGPESRFCGKDGATLVPLN